jgi:transposase
VLDLLPCMTIEDIAHNLNMSWNTIKNIEKVYLQRHYSSPDLSRVRRIAIDEFSVAKGHVYMTVVMDLDTSRVLHVGNDRNQESLQKFWNRVKKKNIAIEAIAMDMWPAYISSVMGNCPGADIVFDRFHIVKILNTKLDELRRDLYRDERELNKRDVLKGTRWLLLRNNNSLTEKAKYRLEAALEINKPLAAAYYLKEELKLLWMQESLENALKFLESWVAKAYETGLAKLREFANTLMAHRTGIINWYKHYISTGPLEGLNNKIKVLKRKAYGYRDFEFFKLKIYALHLSRYELL